MWKAVTETRTKTDEDKHYYNAQEIGVMLNMDRATVIKYIKNGFIKATQKKKSSTYKITHEEYLRIKEFFVRPNKKWEFPYTDEDNAIILTSGLPDKKIAEIIGRSVVSVRIQRCRLKKEK